MCSRACTHGQLDSRLNRLSIAALRNKRVHIQKVWGQIPQTHTDLGGNQILDNKRPRAFNGSRTLMPVEAMAVLSQICTPIGFTVSVGRNKMDRNGPEPRFFDFILTCSGGSPAGPPWQIAWSA